jgi:UDP-GlcNAc:undecaprenyl-phosphate GlcNAc-1-phosphate transferase
MDGSNRMPVLGFDLGRLTESMILWGVPEVLVVMLAAGLAFALAVLLRPACRTIGLVDHPDERKQHGHPVPLAGGVAVAIVIVACIWLLMPDGPNRRVLEAATGLLVVGMLDDRYRITVEARLFWQLVAALWVALVGGQVVTDLGALGQLDVMAVPFTVLCIVAFINACNMVDGADGLLAAALVPACLGIAFIAEGALETAALISGGALLGFLLTNWPARAGSRRTRWRTFLGNGGVKFIATIVAATLIYATQRVHELQPGAVPFMVLIPLAELANTVARRILNGASTTSADTRHFHHRLLAAGLSRHALAVIYLAASSVSVAVGLLLSELGPDAGQLRWTIAAVLLTAATLYGIKRPVATAPAPTSAPEEDALIASLVGAQLEPVPVEVEPDDRRVAS